MASYELADALVSVVPKTMQLIRARIRHSPGEASLTQYRILARLRAYPRSNSELATDLGVSGPAMTRQINAMVKANWVTRVEESGDRRRNRLAATAKGEKVYGLMREKVVQDFAKRIGELNDLDRSDLETGIAALSRLLKPEGRV